MRKIEKAIWITGLALPFIGNALASMQLQQLLPSYIRIYSNINGEYLWFIFILEMFNLIPVVLCVICYWCTVLNRYRYIPIGIVYLFVIYGHYKMTFGEDGMDSLIIIVAPLLSIPVFFIAFIFSLGLAALVHDH